MKTIEELNKIKEEYNSIKSKLSELSEDELLCVTGGYQFLKIMPEEHNVITSQDSPFSQN